MQRQVFIDAAVGVPGMKADMNTFDYYPNNLLAEGVDGIAVGTFVWHGTDPATQGKYGGTGSPIGLVERNIVYPNWDITDDGSEIIQEGLVLTTATYGAFWVKTTTVATVGQAVFALTADGTIATGAPGGTVTDAVETPWTVHTAGEVGDVIIIKRV